MSGRFISLRDSKFGSSTRGSRARETDQDSTPSAPLLFPMSSELIVGETQYHLIETSQNESAPSGVFTVDHIEVRIESRFHSLIQKLEHLRNLEPNWDSYGAETPNETSLDLARRILEQLSNLLFEPSRVVPSAEGGVAIIFQEDDRYALFECFNDGDIAGMMMDRQAVRDVFQVDVDTAELGQAIEQIRAFIEG